MTRAGAGLSADLRIGWRNLGRNPKRTALGLGAIALAQAAMIWISSMMNGYQAVLFNTLTGPLLGHIQVHAPHYLDDQQADRCLPHAAASMAQIMGLPGVASVSARIYAPVLATQKELGHVAVVMGMDVDAEMRPSGLLEKVPPDQRPDANEVLLGEGLASAMGVRSGDRLALMGQAADGSIASGLYTVKALVSTAQQQLNESGIVMRLAAAQDLMAMPDQVHELAVKASDGTSIPALAQAIGALPLLAQQEVRRWDQLAPQLKAMLGLMKSSNLIVLILVFITTISGVANTMLMATFERTHEFGMLLALGCRPARLTRMLLMEALALGLAGAVLGSLLGLGLTWHQVLDFSHSFGDKNLDFQGMSMKLLIPYAPRWSDGCLGAGAVLLTSALACLWPAKRIARLEPSEALRS